MVVLFNALKWSKDTEQDFGVAYSDLALRASGRLDGGKDPPMTNKTDPVPRDSRLDVARGVAIIAIALVHVVRGLTASGRLDSAYADVVARSAGLWCLTVFAFVGGTFVPRAVQRDGLQPYLKERITRIVVVYLIWEVIQGTVRLIAGGDANHHRSIVETFDFWRPDVQLWYLPFLVLVTLFFVPMQPWLTNHAPWALAIAAAVSFTYWGFDGGYIGTQGTGLVVFFVAGLVAGTTKVQSVLDRFGAAQAAAISVVLLPVTGFLCVRTTAILPTYFWFQHTPARVVIGIALTMVASPAILLFGHAARNSRFLSLCGRRSLDIYLAHIVLSSGARIVLIKLGVVNLWVILTLSFLVSIAGSLLVSTALRRSGLGWLFDGPNWSVKVATKQRQDVLDTTDQKVGDRGEVG
ncbi:acyltransferase [Mycobacterium sp. CBMA293]|uniref:acyltransferase family protein n=2 Tax=Mycolicibacterium TaxID=1866885 RepID=UPI0012DD7230|nr:MULTISPECIES: acyltransferase [unclassified Mycolicibacterium]MUM30718.1 acyltransferase [Mycolicibacterium sp. CBMA 361]MUL46244.1 acyltransferase [Mycolicibacterium sp. CBMA 360]MUL58705.1 acyltransferase [Mycolicibacterium sp. CBMA 335]MUL69099.1 acyltransferase [Mycolicibacterium sp. CBMA 311]MUL94063.1 acyltransferase [Mycolicibacterium sp. CBMA 230]